MSISINKLLIIAGIGLLASCKSTAPSMGEKVKEPFSGSAYESNNRFFRAVGKGVSMKDNIAESKADMDAKTELAGQVGTNMRNVSDQYASETGYGNKDEITEKFQSLSRQVMNTELADIRKIGQEKYFNQETGDYTVYIVYEVKKSAMFRFMKKQAKLDEKMNDATRKAVEEILDEEIKRLEAEGED
jgi:hypothetical protein